MCNRECPEPSKTYGGVCCTCYWILGGFKCRHYKCDPTDEYCTQKQAEDATLAQYEAEHELPDYIEEEI